MKFTLCLTFFTLVCQSQSFSLTPRAPPDTPSQVDELQVDVQTDLSWPLVNGPRGSNIPEPGLGELNVEELLDLVEQKLAADLEARPSSEKMPASYNDQIIDLYIPTKEVPKIPSNLISDIMLNLESLKTDEILDLIAAFEEEKRPKETSPIFEPPKQIPMKEQPSNLLPEKVTPESISKTSANLNRPVPTEDLNRILSGLFDTPSKDLEVLNPTEKYHIAVPPSSVSTTSNSLTNDLTNILTKELPNNLIHDVTNELTNNLTDILRNSSPTDSSNDVINPLDSTTKPKLSREELLKFRDYVTIQRSPYTSLLKDFFSDKERAKFKKLYKSSPKLVQETEHVDGPSAKDFSQYESYVDIFIKKPDEVLVETFPPDQLKRLGDIASRYLEYTDVLTEKGLAEIS